MFSGFMCGDCFGRQSVTAFLVVGGLFVLFIFVSSGIHRAKNSRKRQNEIPQTGLAFIGNAGYTQGEISTRVEETIPYLLQQRHYVSNWQEKLLQPINAGKLQAAGFGYTDILMDKRNVGETEGPQTPGEVTILVYAKHKNYYFRVTQSKSVP
jgi:hypothetical protein